MMSESSSAPAKSKLKCPRCDSDRVTRSRRVDLLERGFAVFQYYPYRCQQQTCQHRFYAFGRNRQL